MNIEFRRIGKTPQEFSLQKDDALFTGTLEQHRRDLVLLKGHISGKMNIDCDICAEPFDTILEEDVNFLLSDGIYQGENDEYDIVETDSSVIDMDAIFVSELELIKSDYHRCENCTD